MSFTLFPLSQNLKTLSKLLLSNRGDFLFMSINNEVIHVQYKVYDEIVIVWF